MGCHRRSAPKYLAAILLRGLRDLVGLRSVFFGGMAPGYASFSSHESHTKPAPKASRISWRSNILHERSR